MQPGVINVYVFVFHSQKSVKNRMETLVICVYNGKTLHNKNKNIYYSKLEFYVDFMTADQSLFSKHVDFH